MKILGRAYLFITLIIVTLFARVDIDKGIVFKGVVDKSSSYIGERIILNYIFKYRVDDPILDASFNSPKFDEFWVKKPKLSKKDSKIENGYKIYKIKYILYPQKSGVLHIGKASMDIGLINKKKRGYYSFKSIKREKIYSNSIELNISSLPKGVFVAGHYNFFAVLDKNKTDINTPVNLTITISGSGNVDAIDDFSIDAKNATIYSNKPKRLLELKGDEDVVLFKQKFALLSDQNFTIKPIEFKYFDTTTKKIKILKSKEFKVEVVGSQKKESTLIKSDKKSTDTLKDQGNDFRILFYLISPLLLMIGFGLGILYKSRVLKKSLKKLDISDRIKKAKSNKELLSILLPFGGSSSKIDELILKLEENIYYNKSNKIDKKELYKNFDKFLKDDEIEDILN